MCDGKGQIPVCARAIAQAEELYQVGKENVVDADTPLSPFKGTAGVGPGEEDTPLGHATSRLEVVAAPRLSGRFRFSKSNRKKAVHLTVAKLIKELGSRHVTANLRRRSGVHPAASPIPSVSNDSRLLVQETDRDQKVLAIRSSACLFGLPGAWGRASRATAFPDSGWLERP